MSRRGAGGWLIAAVALALVAAARADPIADVDCTVPQHAQRLINHCSSLKLQDLDRQWAALRRDIERTLPDETDRVRFQAAEDAWLAFRKAQCAFVAPPSRRGSLSSMIYTICARDLTDAHLSQLRSYLDCRVRAPAANCRP